MGIWCSGVVRPLCELSLQPRRSQSILIATVWIALCTHPTQAEFKVCNQTLNLYNIAIGKEINRSFHTEGWWTLPANNCVSPIKEDLDVLKLRYVYIFATTIYGDDALTGDWPMCIDTRKFKIPKVPGEPWNCWIRGYQQAKFKEIDTGNAKSWTVFIRENQN
jgi:uncharacterized membrane protein